jgi:hypothetical protein
LKSLLYQHGSIQTRYKIDRKEKETLLDWMMDDGLLATAKYTIVVTFAY